VPGTPDRRPASPAHTIAVTVSRVPVERTLALRQAVLRPTQTLDEMALPGDDDPATAAFAAIDAGGEVQSVARVSLEAPPFPSDDLAPPGTPAWRLRGMATRPEARDQGIGSAVLQGCIDHVGSHSGGLLWCNARVPAVGLYRRAGFTTYGEEWVDPVIGPHIVMWRLVGSA
jgi:ribosomal protein S18 acetylase RimI-like enzyme